MSAHILFNLLNELRNEMKCEACNEFNKFNNVRFFNHTPLIFFDTLPSITQCYYGLYYVLLHIYYAQ